MLPRPSRDSDLGGSLSSRESPLNFAAGPLRPRRATSHPVSVSENQSVQHTVTVHTAEEVTKQVLAAVRRKAEAATAAKRRICPICCEECEVTSMVQCSTGAHEMCCSCLATHIEAQIAEVLMAEAHSGPHLSARCFAGCTGHFTAPVLGRSLPDELHADHVARCHRLLDREARLEAHQLVYRIQMALKEKLPELSQELLEKQLRDAVPGARQCGSCGFGPILHFKCKNLTTHHKEKTSGGAMVNNSCPECSWFAPDIDAWPVWNGKVRPEAAEDFTNVASHSAECAICMCNDEPRSVFSCGCAKTCWRCAADVVGRGLACPTCRTPGVAVLIEKVFF